MDAGGGNARLLNMLTKAVGATDGDDGWLSDEYVRFQHPVYPERSICVATCSAHGLKALRNALLASSDGGPKDFQMVGSDGKRVGASWRFVQDARKRDLQRADDQLAPTSALSPEAVAVDGYAKMNVALAKQVFHGKTITECLTWAIEVLRDVVGLDVDVQLDAWMKEQKEIRSARRGQSRAVLGELMDQVFWVSNNYGHLWPAGIPNPFPTLEFEVVCGSIFNETLLNKNIQINNKTIDGIENHLKRCLKWFNDWQSFQLSQRDAGATEWCKYFIAPQTWANLRRTVCGFMSFCRYLLSLLPADSMANVPALRSTTSSLESSFGNIKGINNLLLTLQAFMDRSALLDTRDEVTPKGNHFGCSTAETSGSWVRRSNKQTVKQTPYSLSNEIREPARDDATSDTVHKQEEVCDGDLIGLEKAEAEEEEDEYADDNYYEDIDWEFVNPQEQASGAKPGDVTMTCGSEPHTQGLVAGDQDGDVSMQRELEQEEQQEESGRDLTSDFEAEIVMDQGLVDEQAVYLDMQEREAEKQLDIDSSMHDYMMGTEGGNELMASMREGKVNIAIQEKRNAMTCDEAKIAALQGNIKTSKRWAGFTRIDQARIDADLQLQGTKQQRALNVPNMLHLERHRWELIDRYTEHIEASEIVSVFSKIAQLTSKDAAWLWWDDVFRKLLTLVTDVAAKILATKALKTSVQASLFEEELYAINGTAALTDAFTSVHESHGIVPRRRQMIGIFEVVKHCFAQMTRVEIMGATLPVARKLGADNADFQRECHVFTGWALKSTRDHAVLDLKALRKKRAKPTDIASAELLVKRLTAMRRLKADFPTEGVGALPIYLKVYDKGGLSYLIPEFDQWARYLVNFIRCQVTEDTLSNDCIIAGWTNLAKNEELRSLFKEAYKAKFGADVLTSKQGLELGNTIAGSLTLKTYHARLNVVVKHFKQLNTGRFANKKNSDTVRTLMKHDKSATHGAPRCKRKAPVQHNGEKPTKKAKKDPNMPKRGLSSYIFFMQDRRKSIVAKDESLTLAEISKELGRLWKEATADDKLKYEELAKADKERYTKEMESYVAPPATNEDGNDDPKDDSTVEVARKKNKVKKKKKDPNMPKRGLSSYIFFMQDRRKSIVAKDESLTLAEISKELGRLWKEATADDKLKYEDLAKADKERYTKEMESYIAPPATNENGEEQKNGRSKSTTAKSTTAKKRRKKKTTSHPQTAVETDENTNTCN